MCALLHFVELLPSDLPPPLSERATMAVGLVERSNTQLRKLMWKLGQIRRASVVHEKEQKVANETSSISQGLHQSASSAD